MYFSGKANNYAVASVGGPGLELVWVEVGQGGTKGRGDRPTWRGVQGCAVRFQPSPELFDLAIDLGLQGGIHEVVQERPIHDGDMLGLRCSSLGLGRFMLDLALINFIRRNRAGLLAFGLRGGLRMLGFGLGPDLGRSRGLALGSGFLGWRDRNRQLACIARDRFVGQGGRVIVGANWRRGRSN